MLKALLFLLALAFVAGDASAGGRRESSRLYNPEDNPTRAPTPDQFNQQEWERRRAFGVCATLFECGAGGRPGYTHLPYLRRAPVYYYGYPGDYPEPRRRARRPYRRY